MLAIISGRRKRVFFLFQVKNRKIFGLYFLCLNYNAHSLGGIFWLMKVGKTSNSYRILGLVVMEDSPPRAPYIEGEI